MDTLSIRELSCRAGDKSILHSLSFDVKGGETIALLGPNGHGKSTLLNCIMGSPSYEIESGKIILDGKDITSLPVDERSRMGIFMGFQNPPDVPGVVTMDFFRGMVNARREKPISLFEFYKMTTASYESVGLDSKMAERNLNEGYSGGEKKRNEILQMLLLKPQIALLDEIDSGLDVDALSLVADAINQLKKEGTTFILISHYDRLLDLVQPDRTAIMVDGRIALEGDFSLAKRVSKEGYSFLEREYGIDTKKEEKDNSIGVCANKVTA